MKTENVFGTHAKALQLYSKRAEILANNLIHADTPGYAAKDIDFKAILQDSTRAGMDQGDTLYRIPLHPSVDGNTVDGQVEQSEYMQNATRYLASLQFIQHHVRQWTLAIKGT